MRRRAVCDGCAGGSGEGREHWSEGAYGNRHGRGRGGLCAVAAEVTGCEGRGAGGMLMPASKEKGEGLTPKDIRRCTCFLRTATLELLACYAI
jgi:hypothetical protein